jgi:hypothetical protein
MIKKSEIEQTVCKLYIFYRIVANREKRERHLVILEEHKREIMKRKDNKKMQKITKEKLANKEEDQIQSVNTSIKELKNKYNLL